MKTIKVEEILLGPRQRKVIDKAKVETLATSIAEKGLFHAVVCIRDEDDIRLIAGERRLRAVKLLSTTNKSYSHDDSIITPGEIPYILIDSDLSAIQQREAELEENLIRVDLSWQEKVSALDELHELRVARDPKHTAKDTARELVALSEGQHGSSLKQSQREVSQARLVAGHLDSPDVAHAKSLRQAHAIVSKRMEAELTGVLAERGATKPTIHHLILGDFPHIMVKLPPNAFTCIIADPPYGIGAHAFGDAAKLTHTYADDEGAALTLAAAIFEIGHLVAADNAHLYMFCDVDHFTHHRTMGTGFGWDVWRTPIIWHKLSSQSHAPSGTRGFRRSYELILFATKGVKPFSQVYSDVIGAAQPRDKDVAAQKPTALYETLLSRSCLPGDKVLDPCCGSGTIFKAAEHLRLKAWGVEKDAGAHEIAQLTLSSLEEGEEEENE